MTKSGMAANVLTPLLKEAEGKDTKKKNLKEIVQLLRSLTRD